MVESNSSCLETYKITFQSCLYLVWLRSYDKKLILTAILDFFFFFKMLKGENSTPLDVIIYMLEMNNQQKNVIMQKGVTPLDCWTKWASPTVHVPKMKNGKMSVRICRDYKVLNTVKDDDK